MSSNSRIQEISQFFEKKIEGYLQIVNSRSNYRLQLSNLHYKEKISLLEEEITQKEMNEDSSKEVIEVLENELKKAREKEIQFLMKI